MIRQPNFLQPNECEELIDFFWLNYDNSYVNPKNEGNRILDLGEAPLYIPQDPIVKKVWNKLNSYNIIAGIEIHWAQLYEWKENSSMDYHQDFASKHTVYTSVTYLNDDFYGGETKFRDAEDSVPEQGTTIFYDGCKHIHGVNEVRGNRRYTLAAWYRNIE